MKFPRFKLTPRNSPNPETQKKIKTKAQFEFVLGDTKKSEILDSVDFGDVVLLVEIVILDVR